MYTVYAKKSQTAQNRGGISQLGQCPYLSCFPFLLWWYHVEVLLQCVCKYNDVFFMSNLMVWSNPWPNFSSVRELQQSVSGSLGKKKTSAGPDHLYWSSCLLVCWFVCWWVGRWLLKSYIYNSSKITSGPFIKIHLKKHRP